MTSYHLLLVFILKKFFSILPSYFSFPSSSHPAFPFYMLVQSVSNLLLLLFLRDIITTTGGISTNRLASFFLALFSLFTLFSLHLFLKGRKWMRIMMRVMEKKSEECSGIKIPILRYLSAFRYFFSFSFSKTTDHLKWDTQLLHEYIFLSIPLYICIFSLSLSSFSESSNGTFFFILGRLATFFTVPPTPLLSLFVCEMKKGSFLTQL